MLSDLLVATPNVPLGDGKGKADCKDPSTDPAAQAMAFGVMLMAQLPQTSEPTPITGDSSASSIATRTASTATDWHALLSGTATNGLATAAPASGGAPAQDNDAALAQGNTFAEKSMSATSGALAAGSSGSPSSGGVKPFMLVGSASSLAAQTAASAVTAPPSQTSGSAAASNIGATQPAAPALGTRSASPDRPRASSKANNVASADASVTDSAPSSDAKALPAKLTAPATDLAAEGKTKVDLINTPVAIQSPLVRSHSINADSARLDAPLGSSAWGEQLAGYVGSMIQSKTQTASVSVNPPDLGPITIQIRLDSNQATVAFVAPHPDARHALENSLPKLKEMLASSGITLGQTTVSGDTLPQQRSFADSSAYSPRQYSNNLSTDAGAQGAASAGLGNTSVSSTSGRGLVDIFA